MIEEKPPLTVEEIIKKILGHRTANSKTNQKNFDVLTPQRLNHLTEIASKGLSTSENFLKAYNRLNASGWLQKPSLEVTDADLEQLAIDQPWNKPAYKKRLAEFGYSQQEEKPEDSPEVKKIKRGAINKKKQQNLF